MNPSLKQIAAETGLSIATVSRVLRGKGEIAAETRARVLAAAERLHYRPNLLVRGMQTGRSGTIGVMVGLTDFFATLFHGVHDALVAADHVPVLLFARKPGPGDAASNCDELTQIHRLLDRRVDGLILCPIEDEGDDRYWNEVWDHRVPLVAVDRELPRSRADFVGTDDEWGGRLAALHLVELGHRHVGHIAGPAFASTSRLRRSGFESVVRTVPGMRYRVAEDATFTAGEAQAHALLANGDRPTALFAGNDYQARAAYAVASELGLRIPQDLSVIGFADLNFAVSMVPPLTTMRQNPYRIGTEAAGLVLRRSCGELADPEPARIRLKPELILRGSTAPPPV